MTRQLLNIFLSTSFLIAGLPNSLQAQELHTPVFGDAVVTASLGEPRTLVPILASDAPAHAICALVFNGLIKYDRDMQIIGSLAEHWKWLNGGKTLRFYLRKGVTWHDGTPFTADDVKFTFNQITSPAIPTPYSGDFEQVKSLRILDTHTIEVHYKEPFAPALSSWGLWIMPKHLLEGKDLLTTDFKYHPIGTGPYQFKTWKRGQQIELTAYSNYFEGEPYIQRHITRIIPDQATTFLELQAQGIDEMGLSPLQYARMTQTKQFQTHFRKFRYPSLGYTYLGFNLQDERFQDKRVRQAINLAIDKQELIEGVLLGLGTIATGPFPPKSWAYNPNIDPHPHDPTLAKQLLAQAGWQDTNQDGILDKDGKPFSFTILSNQGNLSRKLTAQIIAKRLKEIGIDAKLRILEWATFIDSYIHQRRFEAVLLGWGLSFEPDPYDIWHSSKTGPGEFNFIGYKNPEVDRLLEKGRKTIPQNKRKKIYHRIHQILHEEQPMIFLYVPDALPALHQRFEQVEFSQMGGLWNLIHWYVPEGKQRYRMD